MADNGVSIIIAVWNQLCYTKLTVEYLAKNTRMPFELVIVDNASRPETRSYIDSLRGVMYVQYIRNERNLGPILAINQGIKVAKYDYIMVMHNDVLIMENGWLEKIVSVMQKNPSIGIVGLAGRQEINKKGLVNEASLKHNLQSEDLNAPMAEEVAEVAVIDGLCFTMSRALIDKIGGLDETYGYMHCYDLDVSLASRKEGFRNMVVKISAIHIGNGGMTRSLKEYKQLVKDDYGLLNKNYKIFARKWKDMLPIKIS